jgi:gamma-glutamyl-gamma-aminobutyrate hydrolase PuuD
MGKNGNRERKRRYARVPTRAEGAAENPVEHSVPGGTLPYNTPVTDAYGGPLRIPTVTEVQEIVKKAVNNAREERNAAKHRVTIIGDHKLEFPELYLAVFIVGNEFEQAAFSELLVRSRCHKVSSLEEADFVIFTGGPDVDPSWYGEKQHRTTVIEPRRDESDVTVYLECLELGIPMLGICRGAQFGAVMAGDKLFQDVDGHNSPHHIWDRDEKDLVDRISSVHHQLVRNVTGAMHVIATSGASGRRVINNDITEVGPGRDIEAFFYRESCFLGIQGHPEYAGFNFYSQWCMKKVQQWFLENPDTIWTNDGTRHLRVNPEILRQRKAGLGKLTTEQGDTLVVTTKKGT